MALTVCGLIPALPQLQLAGWGCAVGAVRRSEGWRSFTFKATQPGLHPDAAQGVRSGADAGS